MTNQTAKCAGVVEQIHHHLISARSIEPASKIEADLLDAFQAKRLAFRAAVQAYDDENGQPLLAECFELGKKVGQALVDGRILVKGGAI